MYRNHCAHGIPRLTWVAGILALMCIICTSLTPNANAETGLYEIPGKGIVCHEYSESMAQNVESRHHIAYSRMDGSIYYTVGDWEPIYVKSHATSYGNPTRYA